MVAPVITRDLITITDAETATGWLRNSSSPYGAGGNIQEAISGDFVIQASNSWSFVSAGGANRGAQYDFGSGITLGDSDHVYFWLFLGPASGSENSYGSTDVGSFAGDAGATAWMGTGTATNRIIYGVAGADTYGAGGRNFICYPIKYNNGASTDSDVLVQGSPGASPQYFGGGFNFLSTSRGPNVACDAIRYGRGFGVTDGDQTTPATFAGINLYNDSVNGRWGVFTGIGGGYELQGQIRLGATAAGTADSCYFIDPGSNITVPNTTQSTENLSQILLDGANSKIEITGLSYQALGDYNRGRFHCLSKTADIDLIRNTFNNIGYIRFGKSTNLQACTISGCDEVFLDSATITETSFVNTTSSRAALVAATTTTMSGVNFTSPGTGHAIEITVPGSYAANNFTFSGYNDSVGSNPNPANGSTDAAVYNNSGGLVTFNLTGGTSNFSVRNGPGATTVLQASSTVLVNNLLDSSEVRIFLAGDSTDAGSPSGVELVATGATGISGTEDNRTFTFTVGTGTSIDIRVFHVDYNPVNFLNQLIDGDKSFPVSQEFDRVFDDPL